MTRKPTAFIRVFLLLLFSILILLGCQSPSDDPDSGFDDFDLYFAWSSPCLSAGPDSYQIDMTFGSDGSFYRRERNWTGDNTCAGGATTTETITSTYSLHGQSAGDPSAKLLQYLDNADSTVFALYRVTGTSLEIAENAADYPLDLTDAFNLDR